MTRISSGSPDWADDLLVERAEVNVGHLLSKEAYAQAAIRELQESGAISSPDEIREKYIELIASDTIASESETKKFRNDLYDFGSRATAIARRGKAPRFAITLTCPDAVGILARLTSPLVDEACNVEGAMMCVVAGQFAATIIGTPVSGSGQITDVEFADSLRRLQRKLDGDAALKRMSGRNQTLVRRLGTVQQEWPKVGSTLWHVTVRCSAEDDGLESVTELIADKGIPLFSFSTWLEEDPTSEKTRRVVDLNVPIGPRDSEVIDEIRRELVTLTKGTVSASPTPWPSHVLARKGYISGTIGDIVVTVLGKARPGFVHRVLTGCTRASQNGVAVVSAHMAILDGYTALTILARANIGSPSANLVNQIQASVNNELTDDDAATVLKPYVIRKKGRAAAGQMRHPTHEIQVRVLERPGILARIVQTLADSGVNIMWLVAFVLETRIGEAWPHCAIEIHAVLPNDGGETETRISAELESFRRSEGWETAILRRWSL